jgi:hypothetical protein
VKKQAKTLKVTSPDPKINAALSKVKWTAAVEDDSEMRSAFQDMLLVTRRLHQKIGWCIVKRGERVLLAVWPDCDRPAKWFVQYVRARHARQPGAPIRVDIRKTETDAITAARNALGADWLVSVTMNHTNKFRDGKGVTRCAFYTRECTDRDLFTSKEYNEALSYEQHTARAVLNKGRRIGADKRRVFTPDLIAQIEADAAAAAAKDRNKQTRAAYLQSVCRRRGLHYDGLKTAIRRQKTRS